MSASKISDFSRNVLRVAAVAVALGAAFPAPLACQQNESGQASQATIQKLLERLEAAEARIRQLEQKGGTPSSAAAPAQASIAAALPIADPGVQTVQPQTAADADPMAHMMEIPGGPHLNFRGFFDFNYGAGSIANPTRYPVLYNGCTECGNPATPAHNGFQSGEFDLFMTSKLSEHLSFVGEMVLGPDTSNVYGLDLERYQLTYKANPYFSASAGRFHTSIGYYNTSFHHGNWFSTAQGRPIMYLFEDSGGILPMHMVGLSFSGEVPRTESLGLHWAAEVGNGNASNSAVSASYNAVQNFYTDRNYKATNLAAYIRPKAVSGLQIGGSWYHDGINPSQATTPLPLPEIKQNIESAYVVYLTGKWEIMNEAVMLSNRAMGSAKSFNSPMAYTQVARKFGVYTPYFRYQYVRDNMNDPVNLLRGTFYGPSAGIRFDFSDYAAFKLQYNHLHQSNQLPGNGLNGQLAFTF